MSSHLSHCISIVFSKHVISKPERVILLVFCQFSRSRLTIESTRWGTPALVCESSFIQVFGFYAQFAPSGIRTTELDFHACGCFWKPPTLLVAWQTKGTKGLSTFAFTSTFVDSLATHILAIHSGRLPHLPAKKESWLAWACVSFINVENLRVHWRQLWSLSVAHV